MEELLAVIVNAETMERTERPMTEQEILDYPNLPPLSVPLPEP